MEERERLWSVEVVVEHGRELVPEDRLPALVSRLLLAKEVAEGFDLRLRLNENVVAELDRLAPVSTQEEHQRDFSPPGVEDVAEGHVVAQRLRHLVASHSSDHPVVHPEARKLVAER